MTASFGFSDQRTQQLQQRKFNNHFMAIYSHYEDFDGFFYICIKDFDIIYLFMCIYLSTLSWYWCVFSRFLMAGLATGSVVVFHIDFNRWAILSQIRNTLRYFLFASPEHSSRPGNQCCGSGFVQFPWIRNISMFPATICLF